MGKPLAVDWHEVRTLALAIGVREAARRMGISETAVKRRCTREGWLAERHAAKASLAPIARKEALAVAHGLPSPTVPKLSTGHNTLSTAAVLDVSTAPTAADILGKMPQATLTLKEKRAFLRSVVATPIGEVDETSILAQKVKRRATTNRAGDTETETEIWLPDKLRALELDAKLAGELSDRPATGPLVSLAFYGSPAAHDQVKVIEQPLPELPRPRPILSSTNQSTE